MKSSMKRDEFFVAITTEMVAAGLEALDDARKFCQPDAQMVRDVFIAMCRQGGAVHSGENSTLH